MGKFIGSECIVCKEKFTETDDIVVCPQCGTPYHRECYTNEGSCINTKLHDENKSWSDEKASELSKKCPFCNHNNKPHSLVCEGCGASLTHAQVKSEVQDVINEKNEEFRQSNQNAFIFNPLDKYCGMNDDDLLDGDVKVSEAADFIGVNIQHYLMIFRKMKETGKKISVNIISILFPQFYFAYRKMLPEAILTTVLTALLSIPTIIVYLKGMLSSLIEIGYSADFLKSLNIESISFQFVASVANYASIIISVLAFLFANFLYYRHMQKKIKAIKSRFASKEEISEKIIKKGGTSIFYVLITILLQFIISFVMFLVLISM